MTSFSSKIEPAQTVNPYLYTRLKMLVLQGHVSAGVSSQKLATIHLNVSLSGKSHSRAIASKHPCTGWIITHEVNTSQRCLPCSSPTLQALSTTTAATQAHPHLLSCDMAHRLPGLRAPSDEPHVYYTQGPISGKALSQNCCDSPTCAVSVFCTHRGNQPNSRHEPASLVALYAFVVFNRG